MFPFLIGRIKSCTTEGCYSLGGEFPFLIGRIKRKKEEFMEEVEKKFPFLIGRIKSRALVYKFQKVISVSIPHR